MPGEVIDYDRIRQKISDGLAGESAEWRDGGAGAEKGTILGTDSSVSAEGASSIRTARENQISRREIQRAYWNFTQ